MRIKIGTAANTGCADIFVSADMPRDELLNMMHEYAAECDAAMGDWFPKDHVFAVRAWNCDVFDANSMVQIVHKRQHYSAALVAELIAEDDVKGGK